MDERAAEKRLQDILDKWSEVEEFLKSAELFQSQVVIPAINELRYAGRSIVRGLLKTRDPADPEYAKAFDLADQYLTNANNDIVDSIVVFVGARVSEMNIRFGRAAIEAIDPRYRELNQLLDECRRGIQQTRKSLIMARLDIYQDLKGRMPLLMELFQGLTSTEVIMSAEVGKYQAEIKGLRRLANVLLAAIAMLGVALLVSAVFHVT